MEFGVFGDQRLLEDDRFLRVEAGGEVVGDDFDGVLGDLGGVGVVAGEGVPVGYEIEAVVFGIVLEADPILQGAEIVADVQLAGGAHAADYAFFLRFDGQSLLLVNTARRDALKRAPTLLNFGMRSAERSIAVSNNRVTNGRFRKLSLQS